MEEERLVRNCAPTLAGLKTGSIFTCPYHSREQLLESIRTLNLKFAKKGLRLLPLRFSKSSFPLQVIIALTPSFALRVVLGGFGCPR